MEVMKNCLKGKKAIELLWARFLNVFDLLRENLSGIFELKGKFGLLERKLKV